MKNILELLEKSAKKYPDKTAFADIDNADSYSELIKKSMAIGTFVAKKQIRNKAIAVYMTQSVNSVEAMLGVVYSGNHYVVIDGKMPENRIKNIFSIVKPSLIICDAEHIELSEQLDVDFCCISDITETNADEELLNSIRASQIDTDPVYILFTSGSTGTPKGTVINHRNVLAYSEWLCETFDINENTIYGNQTPFYFSMSVSDVYGTLRSGATLNIIPKKYFSFPVQLINYLNERKVNTIYWVPSALALVANWKALDSLKLDYIEKIMFAGEAIAAKHLNYWRKHLPNAMYANLFGPTETTDICAYWIQNREIADNESVPIGKACDNCECLIIDENGKQADEGELYVRGSFISYGYFNNPDTTVKAFVQNPLNHSYPEKVYKTGDLVRKNKYGELEYISRKDFQIKHMGYRIELGEVEAAANAPEKIKNACAVYDSATDEIILIYEGRKFEEKEYLDILAGSLPTYMMPSKIIRIKNMPYNANGKIDRVWLSKNYKTI
ncbi:MAG: amino acid adenylation domain-containing protein [Clostridia bacterium]|nr:amino acid adenylation domain-containing protein [Clostridia bacterium]